MKKTKLRQSALLLALLLAFTLCLSACGKEDEPTTDDNTAVTTPVAEPEPEPEEGDDTRYSVLTATDAIALVSEKFAPSHTDYTATLTTAFKTGKRNEADYHEYFQVKVTDAQDTVICLVAVEGQSGELYHSTEDYQVSDFRESPLYDPIRDRVIDWNGTFTCESKTITLTQEDDTSFFFEASDGTQGVARIIGNTAQYVETEEEKTDDAKEKTDDAKEKTDDAKEKTDDAEEQPITITFIMNMDDTLTVGGASTQLVGTYKR